MALSTSEPISTLSNEQRLRLLLDATAEHAIFMLDSDGFVRTWNAGAEQISGHPSEAVIGRHVSFFFTPEDRARGVPAHILAQARAAGRHESEGWRVRRDGSRFWALTTAHPVHDGGGRVIGYAEITRDVTAKREAEASLRDAERRFRLLVEGVVDYAICMLDPSGVVTSWNSGAERLTGYTSVEIVGQHFSRFHSKEDRAAGLPAQIIDIASREGRFEAEGWRLRKDGGRFWASVVVDAVRDEAGELIGFAKITRDITERQAAHAALRDSERQFRLLVQGVTDYSFFMLDPNGIVSSWNAGAERIKGYTADEIIGQHFSRFYPERDRAAGMPARALSAAIRNGRFEAEGWRMRKDGTLFWANVVIDTVKDENGELIGFAKVTRDVTERREAQAALDNAQAQRVYLQKMDALGQLTGGVAHDFNNLLMIVSGHLRTIKRLAGSDPKGARAVDAIEAACMRGQSLTRQLLTFSRRQTVNPESVDVAERLRSLQPMLASSVGSATVQITVAPGAWPIRVDVSEFELAVVNLTFNARDAMGQPGSIRITAENLELHANDTPQGLTGDFVAIAVEDTGSGIPPDILPKVFDPFFTTKPVDKGTGLGLSQVHGFAHQSGGTVAITSELGRGTTVTMYLPRADGTMRAPEPEETPEAALGGTVLLIEDNPDVGEVSTELLQQLGYTVHAVRDAAAGLEILERHAFDLVLSDVVMAGSMDGLALARLIRERRPELPIVLVTGYTEAAARAAREFPLLRKPYQLAELSRVIAKVTAEVRHAAPANLVHLHRHRAS